MARTCQLPSPQGFKKLKLVNGPPSSAPGTAPSHAPAPTPSTPTPSPSPGGRVASADDRSVSGSVGSPSAPSDLMASVADQEFCWTGDEDGFEYSPSVGSSSRKTNARVASLCYVFFSLSCFRRVLHSVSLTFFFYG